MNLEANVNTYKNGLTPKGESIKGLYCAVDDGMRICSYCLKHRVIVCQKCVCWNECKDKLIGIKELVDKYLCILPWNADFYGLAVGIKNTALMATSIFQSKQVEIAKNERKYWEYESLSSRNNNDDNETRGFIEDESEEFKNVENALRRLKRVYEREPKVSPQMEKILTISLPKIERTVRSFRKHLNELGHLLEIKNIPEVKKLHNNRLVQQKTLYQKIQLQKCVENINEEVVNLSLLSTRQKCGLIIHKITLILDGFFDRDIVPRVDRYFSFPRADNLVGVRMAHRDSVSNYIDSGHCISFSGKFKVPALDYYNESKYVVAAISPLGFFVHVDDRRNVYITNLNQYLGDPRSQYHSSRDVVNTNNNGPDGKKGNKQRRRKGNDDDFLDNSGVGGLIPEENIVRFKYGKRDITSIGFRRDKMYFSTKYDSIYSIDFFKVLKDRDIINPYCCMPNNKIVDWCDMTYLGTTGKIPFGDDNKKLKIYNAITGAVYTPIDRAGNEITASFTIPTTGITDPSFDFIIVTERKAVPDPFSESEELRFEIQKVKGEYVKDEGYDEPMYGMYRDEYNNDDNGEKKVTGEGKKLIKVYNLIDCYKTRSVPLYFIPSQSRPDDFNSGALFVKEGVTFPSCYVNGKINVLPVESRFSIPFGCIRVWRDVFLVFDTNERRWKSLRITVK